MNIDFINGLCREIELPQKAYDVAFGQFETNGELIEKMVCSSSLDNMQPFLSQLKKDRVSGAAVCLAAALALSEKTYIEYQKRKIPDNIFYDTLSDISVWVKTLEREENICGLAEIMWIRHSLYLNLFKIGRLQYQFYKTDYRSSGLTFSQRRRTPVKDKSAVINIHIPEGGKLDFEACRTSLDEAEDFFAIYYPEYEYNGFVCDSWLLDLSNRKFMSSDSNIIKFAELFDCVFPTRFHNNEIKRRLWGTQTNKKSEIAAFEEATDLQKRTKAYLLNGGKTGNGYGFIKK